MEEFLLSLMRDTLRTFVLVIAKNLASRLTAKKDKKESAPNAAKREGGSEK